MPDTKLFVIEIQPSPSRFFQRNLQLKWNEHIEDLAKEDPDLFVINVSETMFTDDGNPRREELYVCTGTGSNGKSVLFGFLQKVFYRRPLENKNLKYLKNISNMHFTLYTG